MKTPMEFLLSTKVVARNLLAPGNGLLGALAGRGMTWGNRQTSEDAAARLGVDENHAVLELGPGSGWGLRKLAGFAVTTEIVDLGHPVASYTAVHLQK